MTSDKPAVSQMSANSWLLGYIIACSGFCLFDLNPEHAKLRLFFKSLMMPLLICWARRRFEGKAPQLVSIGLVFATLGDVFLDLESIFGEGPWFVLGMLFFLCMQASYLLGYKQLWSQSTGVPTAAKLIYGSVFVAVNVFLGPQLGDLQLPVLFYSMALVGMALFSTAFTTNILVGGAIFALSDFLILANIVGMNFPLRSFSVQVTYVVSQYLIINDWCRLAVKEISNSPLQTKKAN